MSGRSVLVTGTSGRLGSAVAQRLAEECAVVGFDLRSPSDEVAKCLSRSEVGSITDAEAAARAMDGVEAVVHCAAIPGNHRPEHKLVETNVLGTFVLLEAAGNRGHVRRFIYISSVCWFGITEQAADRHMPEYLPLDEGHRSVAVAPYGASKVQAEGWCRWYAGYYGKPVVSIRPSLIVPPHRESKFVARAAPNQRVLNDYVGQDDLIDGIVRAMAYEPKDGFDCFLMNAEDQWTTTPTLELAERFYPGVPVDREKLGRCDGFGALVCCDHAREVLGWSPKYRCAR